MENTEFIPAIAPPPAEPPAYKDRSAGLVIFGVLTILLGLLCALFVPLMFVGMAAAAHKGQGQPQNFTGLFTAGFIYGGLAVLLVWLGIGSILKRRWARALLLIFSWSGLVFGVFMTALMAYVLPKVATLTSSAVPPGQPAAPAGARMVGLVIGFVFMVFAFVLLPLVWVKFYKSANVKATCAACDPKTRWTDACPLTVLGFCVWQWLCAPLMLLIPVTAHGVVPFFGTFLSGGWGSIYCVVLGVGFFYGACQLYRLKQSGWWLLLVLVVLSTLSGVLTYARHDTVEMYRLMHYPQAQIDQMQKSGLNTGNHLLWFTALCLVPFLGYLLFIRRYLRRN